MKTLMKWVIGSLSIVIFLLIISVIVLVMWVDPNAFKPQLADIAKRHNIELSIQGDIDWQFYPVLGFSLEDVSLSPLIMPENKLISISAMSLSVDVLALFNQQLTVKGVLVEGLKAHLIVDENGLANWQAFLLDDKPTSASAKADVDKNAANLQTFSLETLQIKNAGIIYDDQLKKTVYSLKDVNVEADNIAFQKKPFPLTISANVGLAGNNTAEQNGRFEIDAAIMIDEHLSEIEIISSQISAQLESATGKQSIETKAAIALSIPKKEGELVLKSLLLSDMNLVLENTVNKQTITLKNGKVKWLDFAIDQRLSDFLFEAEVTRKVSAAKPLSSTIKLLGNVTVDKAIQEVNLKNFKLNPQFADVSINSDFNMDLQLEPFTYQGELSIKPFNLKKLASNLDITLPEMAHKSALEKLSLSSKVKGNSEKVSLTGLHIDLDNTQIVGLIDVTNSQVQHFRVALKGDQINVDHYLPEMKEVTSTVATSESLQQGVEQLFPVDVLRTLHMKVDLQFQSVIAKTLPLNDVSLALDAEAGRIDMRSLSAKMNKGNLSLQSLLNVQKEKPTLSFTANGNAVPVGDLMKALAIYDKLNGMANFDAKGTAVGNTQDEIMNSMEAVIDVVGNDMQLLDINIEKTLCDLVAKVQNTSVSELQWDNATRLQDLTTRIQLSNGTIKVDKMQAGVDKVAINSLGEMNILKGDFDFAVNARLVDALANTLQCSVTDTRLFNRDLPIRCKGNVDAVGLKTCQPDWRILETLAKTAVKEKIEEKKAIIQNKADEKLDDASIKAKEKINSKLKEKLGDDESKAVKEKFKNLFKQ